MTAKSKQKNLDILAESGAIKYTDTFFYFPSGQIGPVKIDTSKIHSREIFYAMAEDIQSQGWNYTAIAGGESMGTVFSSPLSLKLDKIHISIQKDGKLKGEEISGQDILCLDDMLATGYSMEKRWYPAIKEKNNLIASYFLIDLNEGGKKIMSQIGKPYKALITLDEEEWKSLESNRIFEADQVRDIENWRQNKNAWALQKLQSKEGLEKLMHLENNPSKNKSFRKILRAYETPKKEIGTKIASLLEQEIGSIDHHMFDYEEKEDNE